MSNPQTVLENGVEIATTDDENVEKPVGPSVIQTTERVVTPIQLPVDRPNRFNRNVDPQGKTLFTVLRSTTIQQTLGHPLAYVRVLMQLGYEPLPSVRGRNIFGKEVLFYPNVLRYLQYIFRKEGVLGLYRGFGLTVASKVVNWYATTKADELFEMPNARSGNENEQPTLNSFIQKNLREVRCQSWGILISHPFQVMALRSMAQFIGQEQKYSSWNIFQNAREIYVNEGLGGFFVGLIPRWLLEVSTILITNAIVHVLRTQISLQRDVLPAYQYVAAMIAQSVTYPFSVVTTVSAINRSGLAGARVSVTPVYSNWQDAYKYLRNTQQLKRGSSLFFRTALTATGAPIPGTPIPNL